MRYLISALLPCTRPISNNNQVHRGSRCHRNHTLSCFVFPGICVPANTLLPLLQRLRRYQNTGVHLAPLCLRTLFQIQVPPVLLLRSEATAMVYITSDLFGPADTQSHYHENWHTMTNSQQHAPGLGKRKRHQDPDTTNASRGLRPQHSPAFEHNSDRSYALYTMAPDYRASEHRPVKQVKYINSKLALVKSTSHLMDTDAGASQPVAFTVPQTHAHVFTDLRACHACKSAPKRKRDLENYMDCMRCEGRTCYICARQCLGGCEKKICKECTSEVGPEGDSWCLDCFQRDQYSRH